MELAAALLKEGGTLALCRCRQIANQRKNQKKPAETLQKKKSHSLVKLPTQKEKRWRKRGNRGGEVKKKSVQKNLAAGKPHVRKTKFGKDRPEESTAALRKKKALASSSLWGRKAEGGQPTGARLNTTGQSGGLTVREKQEGLSAKRSERRKAPKNRFQGKGERPIEKGLQRRIQAGRTGTRLAAGLLEKGPHWMKKKRKPDVLPAESLTPKTFMMQTPRKKTASVPFAYKNRESVGKRIPVSGLRGVEPGEFQPLLCDWEKRSGAYKKIGGGKSTRYGLAGFRTQHPRGDGRNRHGWATLDARALLLTCQSGGGNGNHEWGAGAKLRTV